MPDLEFQATHIKLFGLGSRADFKAVVGGYSDIASIKEFVDVRPKENSILNPVFYFPLIISRA